ncbi:MAG: NAD-dependent DNA ligase LigA, partial [Firmicutes bacterium]|nr:NAD-dependent DNA ligase LigA [Bacillota bacterium]
INSIERSKNVQLANFIFALGINHVGVRNAKLLVKKYGSDIEKIMSADEEELAQIEGFGEIIARSVERYFSHEDNIKRIEKALGYLNIEKAEEESGEKTLENKTFVITGDVYKFKNRKELQKKIEELGGKATGSVSGKTDYLINNDVNSTSSKNKKAKELGVMIITEDEFIEMIGGETVVR